MIAAARSGGLRWKGRQGSSNWREGCRLEELGWGRKRRRCLTAGGEGEDSGCQIGSRRLRNLLPPLHKNTLAGKHNEWRCCAAHRGNKGLMPYSGLRAAEPHYPEMDKSIWSNYINQWNIWFLWKQMWVIPHKSLPSVKYSRAGDVSLSNEHLNSCVTAVIDMMWWISDSPPAAQLYIIYVVLPEFQSGVLCKPHLPPRPG